MELKRATEEGQLQNSHFAAAPLRNAQRYTGSSRNLSLNFCRVSSVTPQAFR